MNPLKRLISQLTEPRASSGTVVYVSGGKATIKTSDGAIMVPTDPLQHLSVGDTVLVSNGAIVGKDRDLSSIPTFYV
jgi:hypothetical protein